MNILFIGLLLFNAITDIKNYKIYNIVVWPAVFISNFFTGFWIQSICAFCLMAVLLWNINRKPILNWYGGDVKLFMLIAAFKGWMFIPILIGTHLLIKLYRVMLNYKYGLPVAPFACVASIFLMILAVAFEWIVHLRVA